VSRETDLDGFVLVDKPPDWTSFDAVRWVRKALHGAKVGHSGTLDPMATGLLILLVGRATRLMQYLEGYRKRYEGTMRLGVRTDTCDRTGEVEFEADPEELDSIEAGDVEERFQAWTGDVEQVPPQFSAVKIEGTPAYKIARRGGEPDLEPRDIVIHSLELEEFDSPDVHFRAEVGTGTYLRAIARDIGEELGVGGHLLELRRTGIGPFSVQEAFPLEEPEGEGYVREWVRPMAELLPKEMIVEVTPAQARRITHGNELRLPSESVRYAAEFSYVGAVCRDDLIAMGRLIVVGQEGLFQPRTVVANPRGYGG